MAAQEAMDDDKMDVDKAVAAHFTQSLSAKSAPLPEPVERIDLAGDGGVVKVVQQEGEGWERPTKGSDVSCASLFPLNCTICLNLNSRVDFFAIQVTMWEVSRMAQSLTAAASAGRLLGFR